MVVVGVGGRQWPNETQKRGTIVRESCRAGWDGGGRGDTKPGGATQGRAGVGGARQGVTGRGTAGGGGARAPEVVPRRHQRGALAQGTEGRLLLALLHHLSQPQEHLLQAGHADAEG